MRGYIFVARVLMLRMKREINKQEEKTNAAYFFGTSRGIFRLPKEEKTV